jgi:hypothetical protein
VASPPATTGAGAPTGVPTDASAGRSALYNYGGGGFLIMALDGVNPNIPLQAGRGLPTFGPDYNAIADIQRGRLRRIDYYIAPAAAAVINGLRSERGGDTSSIINRIIAEWAERDESFSFQPTLCDMRTNSQTKPV